MPPGVPALDPCLLPLLRAASDAAARGELERLVAAARPIIRRVLQARLGGGEERQMAEELEAEAVAALCASLTRLRSDPQARGVRHFQAFARVTADHAWHRFMERKHPRRAALRKKLEHLLSNRTSQTGFALWRVNGERVAGFAAWEGRPPVRSRRCERLLADPLAGIETLPTYPSGPGANPAAQLAALFDALGGPIALPDLVSACALLWGVAEPRSVGLAEWEEEPGAVGVAGQVEQRAYLTWLWSEVRVLPPRQRAALLLNLRDAGERALETPEETAARRGVLELLPILGVATFDEIAEALEMRPEELAALWSRLPIDDAAIARRLGCRPDQVPGLRRAAQARLSRRSGAWGAGTVSIDPGPEDPGPEGERRASAGQFGRPSRSGEPEV